MRYVAAFVVLAWTFSCVCTIGRNPPPEKPKENLGTRVGADKAKNSGPSLDKAKGIKGPERGTTDKSP